jgi:hypothetical protein
MVALLYLSCEPTSVILSQWRNLSRSMRIDHVVAPYRIMRNWGWSHMGFHCSRMHINKGQAFFKKLSPRRLDDSSLNFRSK